jgi:hypothetical protein
LIGAASKDIMEFVLRLANEETRRLVIREREGVSRHVYIPVPDAAICIDENEITRIKKALYNILMEDVYVPMMMKEKP